MEILPPSKEVWFPKCKSKTFMTIINNLYISMLLLFFLFKGKKSPPEEPSSTSEPALQSFAADPGQSSMNSSKYILVILKLVALGICVIINGARGSKCLCITVQ